ncbi:DUF6454 family protein [Deinococcus altitudinis]|uniref:DUF6454 family protein n=1 Tax=Deinococcus altitudinis TaxID=468914 RepID=UPI003892A1F1
MKRLAALIGFVLFIGSTTYADIPNVAADLPKLSRSSVWTPLSNFKLQFPSFHPQGMVKVGDIYYMSSVEILEATQRYPQVQNGLDRSAGKGRAHLFKFDNTGKLLADIILAAGEGDVYHPGGLDFDGRYVYVPVAEYRPDSNTILYKVDVTTDKATEVLRYRDHLGGVVVDLTGKKLHLISWGARRWYSWPLDARGNPATTMTQMRPNPMSYIDYQDCHHLEAKLSLCSGVAYLTGHPSKTIFGLGGLEVVNFNTGRVLAGFPVPLWESVPASASQPTNLAMTTNPFTVWNDQGTLTFAFAPHDDETTVYLYSVK